MSYVLGILCFAALIYSGTRRQCPVCRKIQWWAKRAGYMGYRCRMCDHPWEE